MVVPLIIAVCAGGLVLAAFLFFWWGSKPAKHRNLTPDRLKGILDTLLTRGTDSGTVVIECKRGREFVQFQKYIQGPGRVGIELTFPKAPWSEPYYDQVLRLVKERRVPNNVAVTPPAQPTTEFVMADFGRDVKRAQEFAYEVLSDILKVDPARDCAAYFQGISPDLSARIGFDG